MHNTNGHPTDSELAARIQARDPQALELLFERYGEVLRRHLCSYLRADPAPEAVAQDLAQELFLRVWMRAEQWTGQGSLKGWLYRIASNLALNHLRSARRHPAQPLAGEEESQWDEWAEEEVFSAPGWLVDSTTLGPDDALEHAERSAELQRAIQALPEQKREVFRLVHEMELSIRDTAGQLGIPEGTVKSRLHYAEKQVQQAWRSLEPTEEGKES